MVHRSRPTWRLPVAFLLVLAVFVLAGCQPAQTQSAGPTVAPPPAIPEVTIAVNADGIVVPADFPGGIVAVTVKNTDSKDLDVGFNRIVEGHTSAEVQPLLDDFMANMDALMQMTSSMGSFNPVPAGGEMEIIIDFRTGEFIVDSTEHSDGEPVAGAPHLFAIVEAKEIVGTVEPQADVVVELHDFAYVMPDEIKAGDQLWEFKNEGEQFHMMFLVKPNAGVNMVDLMAALAAEGEPTGPPPFEFVDGGTAPIGVGERVWVKFALEPGTYVAACPLPDMVAMMSGEQPMSHFQEGMMRTLTVTE